MKHTIQIEKIGLFTWTTCNLLVNLGSATTLLSCSVFFKGSFKVVICTFQLIPWLVRGRQRKPIKLILSALQGLQIILANACRTKGGWQNCGIWSRAALFLILLECKLSNMNIRFIFMPLKCTFFWYIILRDKIFQGSTQFSLYKSHSKEPKKDKKKP